MQASSVIGAEDSGADTVSGTGAAAGAATESEPGTDTDTVSGTDGKERAFPAAPERAGSGKATTPADGPAAKAADVRKAGVHKIDARAIKTVRFMRIFNCSLFARNTCQPDAKPDRRMNDRRLHFTPAVRNVKYFYTCVKNLDTGGAFSG